MIKRLRVTVDGKTYDVAVEIPDESAPQATHAAAPISAPAPVPPSSAPPPQQPSPAAPPQAKPIAASGPGGVPSPLSGRVTAVMVQVGQNVAEGTHLVTLEAMKMNTFVFAPKSGRVAALNVDVGSVVDEGQTLVTIE